MSRAEIPDAFYDTLFANEVARALENDPLNDLWAARQRAHEIMESTYIRRSTAIQCDVQKDFDDERQGDWTR